MYNLKSEINSKNMQKAKEKRNTIILIQFYTIILSDLMFLENVYEKFTDVYYNL